MKHFKAIQEKVNTKIQKEDFSGIPSGLYEPLEYVIELGGKRIRPCLLLMACELFGKNPDEALDPAIGMELFHNFTLIHDDIMDEAVMRRGQSTVHQKWNQNNAILSGDLMQILANQHLLKVDDEVLREVLTLYNQTAVKVCEGQQMDMNFEVDNRVCLDDYLEMISLKTASLLAACLQMGGIIARTSQPHKEAIYDFGLNMGIAFQIQDDFLDAFGQSDQFGKHIGGDILAGKKTYLYVKAKELAGNAEQQKLDELMNDGQLPDADKVTAVTNIYQDLGIKEATEQVRDDYFDRALTSLHQINRPETDKKPLLNLAEYLMQRQQ